jgi:hypothetical protein
LPKLLLYSIFHGNLNYSSIPEESFHEIIDSCYWPVLTAIKNFNFKSGIEFPVNTLNRINEIDPLFINELKNLIKQKKCELIFSGKEQIVSPLIPKEINDRNYSEGIKELEKKMPIKKQIAYVHEQIFSNGLIPLYLKSKFKNIMIIYETASLTYKSDKNPNFFPVTIKSKKDQINVIWNSRHAYQKFQKYITGKIKKNDYLNFILKNKKLEDTCFPFYGSDMEIFGYNNPVLGLKSDGNEIKRFYDILEEIQKHDELEFILPSNLMKIFPPSRKIKICSAKFPILGKKEESIVTRWAVCGRDNSKSNSLCYQAFKKIKMLQNLQTERQNKKDPYLLELVDCWGSDYRTHTEEKKFHNFNKNINTLNHELDKKIKGIVSSSLRQKKSDLVIYNPNRSDWKKIPIEIKLHFKPKFMTNNFEVHSNGKILNSQLEDIKFYKNGYVRSVTLVITPVIPKNSKIGIRLIENDVKIALENYSSNFVKTNNTEISLSKIGGIISRLKFPVISEKPIINITKSFADKKTDVTNLLPGQIFTRDKTGNEFSDLTETKIILENQSQTIRKKLTCDLVLPFADIKKIFYVYNDIPRIDLKYIFTFKDYRPSIFRINLANLNSKNFNSNSFSYSSNNGGNLESFMLKESILQDSPTNTNISTTGCLGSTNCILDVGDENYGITIFTDKALWYSVPMINFKESSKLPLRIISSVCEHDDTTMTWWKGRKEISFSIFGRSRNIDQIQKTCKNMFIGLIYGSDNPNIRVTN